MIHYQLPGDRRYQESLFPCPSLLDQDTRLEKSLQAPADVIRHFVASSLAEDGISYEAASLEVSLIDTDQGYRVSFRPLPGFAEQAETFAATHRRLLDADHFGLGLRGAEVCRHTPAWNPMASYPVNGKTMGPVNGSPICRWGCRS